MCHNCTQEERHYYLSAGAQGEADIGDELDSFLLHERVACTLPHACYDGVDAAFSVLQLLTSLMTQGTEHGSMVQTQESIIDGVYHEGPARGKTCMRACCVHLQRPRLHSRRDLLRESS